MLLIYHLDSKSRQFYGNWQQKDIKNAPLGRILVSLNIHNACSNVIFSKVGRRSFNLNDGVKGSSLQVLS